MGRLFQKRKQIDPKTLRKHSRIVNERAESMLVVGERNQTDFGFEIPGHKSKGFETLFMTMMPSATTPTWKHAKKTRVFRVVSGAGHHQKYINDVECETNSISAGDEIVAEPGDIHRITATTKLELFVVQDSKYTASLEEVAPAEQLADVPASELIGISAEEKLIRSNGTSFRRSRSKAVEQTRRARGEAESFVASRAALGEEKLLRGGDGGINAMPILDLSEEGAG